ncbi:head protein [Yersinia phage vB_Yen_X1]|nr:head protein [Yersinia phage vB_Yen_X1]
MARINLIAELRKYKKGKGKKTLRISNRYPHRIEKGYEKQLVSIISKNDRRLRELVKGFISASTGGVTRDDVLAFIQARINEMVRENLPTAVTTQLESTASSIVVNRDKMTSEAIRKAIGVNLTLPYGDLSAKLAAWVEMNTGLITKLSTDHLTAIQEIIGRGFRGGVSVRELAKEIAERTAMSKRRARLIARDQIGTLNGQVTEERNTELGIAKYIWRTMEDERVRGNPSGKYPRAKPSHFSFNGKIYTWKDGTGTKDKHPSYGIQCRCYAESIVEF